MIILSDDKCKFTGQPTFTKISINELVGVEIEDEYKKNQKVYTITAKFSTCDKEAMTGLHLAFRLTAVNGKKYLLGTNARPYPIIKEVNTYPEKATDSTLKTVTVIWKSLHPLLQIVE